MLSSSIPTPLLSAVLDALFNRFQPPTISMLTSPLTAAVAAGVRSALVVDLGWSETVVTSVYEYREVHCRRTVRGGRMLVEQMHKFLARHLAQKRGGAFEDDADENPQEHALSFEECDEVVSRVAWCKPSQSSSGSQMREGLPTVQEQDESEHIVPTANNDIISIPSGPRRLPPHCRSPMSSSQSLSRIHSFSLQYTHSSFDDHELPVHHLVYQALLELPLDVRAACMSRIIFAGGCANVLGLRRRIFDDVSGFVGDRGWDPARGSAVKQLRTNPKLKKRASRQASEGLRDIASPASGEGQEDQDGVWHDAANAAPEMDPIDEQLRKNSTSKPRVQGQMRAIESLGAWTGASLVSQLKVPAIVTIEREIWLAQGAVGGQSKPTEVDFEGSTKAEPWAREA